MRAHILVHAPFEAPGYVEQWIQEKGFSLSYTKVYEGESYPSIDSFDFLVVMGGPMGAYDDDIYPWMSTEKQLIKHAIDAKKKVLGICLGSQLLANVLGAKVYPNAHKEIGWWTVRKVDRKEKTIFDSYPNEATVMEWHGDTFDLPEGALLVATNDVAKNQAFVYGDHVLALQFHPEMTRESLLLLTDEEKANFKAGTYIQDLDYILSEERFFEQGKTIMYNLLNDLIAS